MPHIPARDEREKERGEREREWGLRDKELYQYMYIHTMYIPGSIIDNKCETLNNVTYSCKKTREKEKERERERERE